MANRLVYLPAAEADLDAIYDWIADSADPQTAFGYTARLQEACEKLTDYPNRGAPHDDIMAGMRTIPFERRATIAYAVEGHEVRIIRILYAGRDLRRAFARE